MAAPTLVVVSGPPGAGKTRLAHDLARAVACPAVCRDEIKEGMVHAEPGEFRPAAGDPLTVRAFETFFDVLRVMVTAGVTVVAEAAFQNRLWRSGLEPLSELARLRVVQCTVDVAAARTRIASRRAAAEPGRAAHAEILDLDSLEESFAAFERISISAPSIVVDTTDGYSPGLPEIVEFRQPARGMTAAAQSGVCESRRVGPSGAVARLVSSVSLVTPLASGRSCVSWE